MAKQISDVPRVAPAPATPANLFTTRHSAFIWLALLLIALAILRSAISTRLDGFTIDEAYHIAAGVSYVKYHDFRINPPASCETLGGHRHVCNRISTGLASPIQ